MFQSDIQAHCESVLWAYSRGCPEGWSTRFYSLLQIPLLTVTDLTEEVYGFDVPVEALNQEFDLALLGTKGTWYDHKVSVSDPQKVE